MKPFRNQKFEGTEVVLRSRTLPGTHPFWEREREKVPRSFLRRVGEWLRISKKSEDHGAQELLLSSEWPPEEPPPIKRWWDWVTLFSPKAAEEAIERFEGEAPRERETWERPL